MDENQLFMDYLRELQKETPRGAVIISCVVIGELLGKILEKHLIDHKDVKELVSGFSAPLGTLSARIRMSFGLRLIDEKEYRGMDIIRRIRNHFAHDLHASFADPKVVSLCNELIVSGVDPSLMDTPAKKYNAVATTLIVQLTRKAEAPTKNPHR